MVVVRVAAVAVVDGGLLLSSTVLFVNDDGEGCGSLSSTVLFVVVIIDGESSSSVEFDI